MFRIMPESVPLNYLILIVTWLKWAWDCILYLSFFQPRGIELLDYVDELNVGRYEKSTDSGESVECAVCLCRIEEGDEVRDLRCGHLFHKACLDRWVGYGHGTCPLCRNSLEAPRFTAELHQGLILIDFSAARSRDDRCLWWLR